MNNKEKILQATIQAFNQKGLKFTMDDIASILAMSKKTIYTIFKDKNTLFMEMVDYLFDTIKESESEIIEDNTLSTIEKIRRILGVMPESYKDIDLRQLYMLKDKFPEIYRHVEERLENGWETTIKLLEQGIEEEVIRPVADYKVTIKKNKYIGDMLGVYDVRVADKPASVSNGNKEEFDTDKGIIVGNIRMGFGHYRISMAIASAANALGYVPYWMDLNSYDNTTCTKVIRAQNDLYSLGSRLSQKSRLFNRLVWEPMNYEGFRKLSYNASDQKNAELMAPVYKNVPKNIPVIATHVWPAQAAVHAGMKNVVNAIPDNWPMALHLSEGSIHTVQTHYAYQGYRILNGMSGIKVLNEMPADSLVVSGHYIDHELVTNIEADCNARIARKQNGKPMRFLLTIGGAGAQKEIFAHIIKYLIPYIKKNKAVLYVNVGDYKNVWDELIRDIPQMRELATEHFDNWKDTKAFATKALSASQINNSDVVTDNNGDDNSKNITADNSSEDTSDNITGIHGFYHKNIFEAVYCTNLLMRSADVLVTKPSELAFYPVPKLFIKRVGGHEQWGAVHSAEIGDGTLECRDIPHTLQMIKLFMEDDTYIIDMCKNIKKNKQMSIYNGAYEAVKLAVNMKKSDI